METKFGVIDNAGKVTPILSIDLNKIPSSDPLAFAYGMSSGRQYALELEEEEKKLKINRKYRKYKEIHGSDYGELAQEYLRGFLLGCKNILVKEGTKIKKGMEMTYFYLSDNLLKDE